MSDPLDDSSINGGRLVNDEYIADDGDDAGGLFGSGSEDEELEYGSHFFHSLV